MTWAAEGRGVHGGGNGGLGGAAAAVADAMIEGREAEAQPRCLALILVEGEDLASRGGGLHEERIRGGVLMCAGRERGAGFIAASTKQFKCLLSNGAEMRCRWG